jgi:amidase
VHCFERAREQAERLADADFADHERSLCGLPIGVKDYNDIGGVRTTYGSPIFADHIASISDATVARLERNGAIPIAKTNVPE